MLIEQPPRLYRLLFPNAVWRLREKGRRTVYLTFDDGPIPEVTPWVLDVLDRYGVKATFFMVGDNVRKHPSTFEMVKQRGHSWGNHTMHHVQGMKMTHDDYAADIAEAQSLIDSRYFRPPHGLMKRGQGARTRRDFTIVMYDLVTRDYSRKMTPEKVLANVKRYTRDGSIIVFHDSLKAERNLREALPAAIEWLQSQGYEFRVFPMD